MVRFDSNQHTMTALLGYGGSLAYLIQTHKKNHQVILACCFSDYLIVNICLNIWLYAMIIP